MQSKTYGETERNCDLNELPCYLYLSLEECHGEEVGVFSREASRDNIRLGTLNPKT
jgi:hypothetical protein